MLKSFLHPLTLVFGAIAVASATPVRSETPSSPPREVSLDPQAGELDILRTAPTVPAIAAVVSDPAGVLVFAHQPIGFVKNERRWGHKHEDGPQLSLFRLDAKGEVTSDEPTTITLPKPKKLAARQTYPLALAVHPKHPLLYVWQDMSLPGEGEPADEPQTDGFQHLLVYDLLSAEPKLVQSLADGESFARGNWAGSIELDRTATRLFVPNMQLPAAAGFKPAIGYYRLLEDGSVVPNEEEIANLGAGGRGTTADRTEHLSNLAHKAYLEQVRTGKLLDRTIRYATSASSTFANLPSGLGFFNVSDSVTIVCGELGPVTWDEANRRAQFSTITFYPVIGAGHRYRMVGHPRLPVVFLTALTSPYFYRMDHVDGFLTMLPQRGSLANKSLIFSPPVLLGDRPFFACGGAHAVHLVGFDKQGFFNGELKDVAVDCPAVAALTYSARFDRLYAAASVGKKKK